MFQENPNNNNLSSILPCEQLLTAKSVLTDVSSEIYDLVNQVNTQIAISYPHIALVCNPFSQSPYYEYQPQNCAANTIRIGDIPKSRYAFQCYEDFIFRFVKNFGHLVGDLIQKKHWYPAHPFAEGRWMFSEIVEFHCYDKYM
ncbi:uncharacterized protein E5676_scaffold546G001940 [Cucumis melo var. makuwa]|uniref:Uncharacterized protein n=1 Tax=Cucumis melo var. makuwa TaxID=1194695 RepID=A0A5D3BBZ0_CUCMM|nr:uncharacterized protein E5676_scaffold546G001940 [Cucumis melo var. makuwa]